MLALITNFRSRQQFGAFTDSGHSLGLTRPPPNLFDRPPTMTSTHPCELSQPTQAQLDDLIARRHAPGISHTVVTADQVLFTGHAGVQDAGENTPVGSQTLQFGCSTTKLLTAIVVLQLTERGTDSMSA